MNPDDSIKCSNCGFNTSTNSMRCPKCGESLKKDKVSLDKDISEEKRKAMQRLLDIPKVNEEEAEILYENGFRSIKDIVEGGMRELAGIYRFSFDTSDKILENAKKLHEPEIEKEEPKEETGGSKPEESGLDQLTKDASEFKWKETEEEYDEDKTIEELLEEKRKEETSEEKETSEEEKAPEKKVKSKPKKNVVVKKDRVKQKTVTKFDLLKSISLFVSFAVPIFLLIFTSLELISVLIGYPSVYPHPVLFYLSPAYLVELSWLSSLTLSFLVILLLTIITLKYYDFSPSEAVYIKKGLLFPSFLINVLIGGSLSLHIYHVYDASPDVLTYLILVLLIFLLISHITLLIIDKRVSPFKKEKIKICPECKTEMSLLIENCPNCGIGIPKIGSPSFEKEEEKLELSKIEETEEEEIEDEDKEIEESSPDTEKEDEKVLDKASDSKDGVEKEETSKSEKSESEKESITPEDEEESEELQEETKKEEQKTEDKEESSTESNEEDKEGQEEIKTDKKESEDKDKKDSSLGDNFAGFGEKVRKSVEERLEDESEKEDT